MSNLSFIMGDYFYEPLVYGDQIRILTLMPGSERDRVEGTMSCIRISLLPASTSEDTETVWTWDHKQSGEEHTVRPEEQGHPTDFLQPTYTFSCDRVEYTSNSYDALSYVWGNPERVEDMLVNGKILGTTRNLHTGLLRLRHPTEPRRLWIDAICIDQSNLHERNHQVRLMQRVYSAASSVIVWLGDARDYGMDLALDMILDYNNPFTSKRDILSYSLIALGGWRSLFQRSWWTRVWIVQEVFSARELVIALGRDTFPWVYLREICSKFREEEFSNIIITAHLQWCDYAKFEDLDFFRSAGYMPIAHLLRSTRGYHATVESDRVYALLGMASDMSPQNLVPDYNKPFRKVLFDLVQFMAVRWGSLDLICSGRFPDHERIPSWLPRWQEHIGTQPFGGSGRTYHANRDTTAVVDLSQFPRNLIAEGVIADTVEVSMFQSVVKYPPQCTEMMKRWHDLSTQGNKSLDAGFLDLLTAGEHSHEHLLADGLEAFLQELDNGHSTDPQSLLNVITRNVMGKCFFTTTSGRIGLGPADVQKNDRVAVFKGCHIPLIIRPWEDGWAIVGEAYVLRMMMGEVISDLDRGVYKAQMITLQ